MLLSKEQSTLSGERTPNVFFFLIMSLFRLSKTLTEDIYLSMEYVFSVQREIHTIKGDNSKCIFFQNHAPF